MRVSENLRTLRKNQFLSQKQLADELYISEDAISSYERGKSQPPLEQLIAICEFFRISVDDLLNKKIPELFYDNIERRDTPEYLQNTNIKCSKDSHIHMQRRGQERKVFGEIHTFLEMKFKEYIPNISPICKIKICILDTLQYDEYRCLADLPAGKYDDYYIFAMADAGKEMKFDPNHPQPVEEEYRIYTDVWLMPCKKFYLSSISMYEYYEAGGKIGVGVDDRDS